MTTWHDYVKEEGHAPSWPYPIRFGEEQEIDTDVLVIGGGIAGLRAALEVPARLGMLVTTARKAATVATAQRRAPLGLMAALVTAARGGMRAE